MRQGAGAHRVLLAPADPQPRWSRPEGPAEPGGSSVVAAAGAVGSVTGASNTAVQIRNSSTAGFAISGYRSTFGCLGIWEAVFNKWTKQGGFAVVDSVTYNLHQVLNTN